MAPHRACTMLAALCGSFAFDARLGGPLTELYSFVSLNYTWQNASQLSSFVVNGQWVPSNNIITGLKFYGGNVFVTVPRWRSGVPSTLNKIVLDATNAPVLQPFPSWDFNDINNVAALRYVQSMEIQPNGLMWILDVGRLNIFDNASIAPVVNGPPKLVLYDLPSSSVVQTYVFTDDVASWSGSFLNDIVVDVTAGYGYISDAWGGGGIVVYDRTGNRARRFQGASTQADPSVNITINGVYYPTIDTPSDGIALSPDRTKLYYCALRGQTLYMLPTSALQDFSLSNAQLNGMVVTIGAKPPSDGMTFTSAGLLIFGSLTGDAIYAWDTTKGPLTSQAMIAYNYTSMQWQDTFAFAGPNLLAFTTNRLQLFFAGTMDWTGASGANMRIFTLSVNGSSYMANMAPYNPSTAPCEAGRKDVIALSVMGVILGLLLGAIGFFAYRSWCRRRTPVPQVQAETKVEPLLAPGAY